MASEYWYVRNRGRVTGPFSTTQLENFRRRGQLSKFHEVSQDKRSWTAATSLQGLFDDPLVNETTSQDIPVQEAEPAPQPTEAWFYNTGQAPAGPVNTRQLTTLVQSGQIGPETQVWKQGTPNWVVLREVPEFAHLLTASGNGSERPPFAGATDGHDRAPDGTKIHRPWFFVIAAATTGFLIVLAVVATMMLIKNRDKGDGGIVGDSSRVVQVNEKHPELIINGHLSESIPKAVGLVVCGWIMYKNDGEVRDIIESTGSCFAVTSNGFLFTNRHVIEDTQKRQRKSRDKDFDKDYMRQDFAESYTANVRVAETLKQWAKDGRLKVSDDPEELTREILKVLRTESFRSDNLANAQAYVKKEIKSVEPTVWVFFARDKYIAEIKHTSDLYDLGVLKIDRDDSPYFRLVSADEKTFRQGAQVYALGFPAASLKPITQQEAAKLKSKEDFERIENRLPPDAFRYNITAGVVALLHLDADQISIQHTAQISPGNSGGPLIDSRGIVFGINSWGTRSESNGFTVQNYHALGIPQTLTELRHYVKDMFNSSRSGSNRVNLRGLLGQ